MEKEKAHLLKAGPVFADIPGDGPASMNNYTYTPSRLLPGEMANLRERSFTRWLSRDLLQPSTDFLKNIGLVAIYTECSAENWYRSIQWHAPQRCGCEIRSGRTYEQFVEFDRSNVGRGWPLLSLYINENNIYSAVWIEPAHYDTAKKVLASYGIIPAVRTLIP